MTRDELIALLLMVGFVQDRPAHGYPRRAHVYYTDSAAVSIVPDEGWGVWDARARAHASARTRDLSRARARAHAHDHTRARASAHALGTPSEYSKCWQTIKELINDQR